MILKKKRGFCVLLWSFVFVLLSCNKVKQEETSVTESNDEKERLISKEKINKILHFPIPLYQVEYENKAHYDTFPVISIPMGYEYSYHDASYYEDDAPEDIGTLEITNDFSISLDKLIAFNIESSEDYASYGMDEEVYLIPSPKTEAISIKKIKEYQIEENEYSRFEERMLYEDGNSLIFLNDFGDPMIVHYQYDEEHLSYVYYIAKVDLIDLNTEENIEMAFYMLRNAKNLLVKPDTVSTQPLDTWEEYILAIPVVKQKGYNHALRNVEKEMKVFMEKGEYYDLRGLYNKSSFDFYYATDEFDYAFAEAVDSLLAGKLVHKSLEYRNDGIFLEDERRSNKEGFFKIDTLGKSSILYFLKYDSFDDDYDTISYFFHKMEKDYKSFYFLRQINSKEDMKFYNRMLEYYHKHKTLNLE